MTSRTVWSSGKNILIGALHQRKSTLKVTEVSTCKNKYTFFCKYIPVFFGSPLVKCYSFNRFTIYFQGQYLSMKKSLVHKGGKGPSQWPLEGWVMEDNVSEGEEDWLSRLFPQLLVPAKCQLRSFLAFKGKTRHSQKELSVLASSLIHC